MYHFNRKSVLRNAKDQDLRAITLLKKMDINNKSDIGLDEKINNDARYQIELESLVMQYDKESKMNVKTVGNVTFLMEHIAVSKKAS